MRIINTASIKMYEFGSFQVDVTERSLTRGTELIPLTPKIFDTLLVLLENAGHIVTKDELLERLWPDTFVEESSLAQNIFQLRKALNESSADLQYIETIPKRGYRFSAPVQTTPSAEIEELVLKRHSETSVVIEQEFQSGQSTDDGLKTVISPVGFTFSKRQLIILGAGILILVTLSVFISRQFRAENSKAAISDVRTLAVLPFNPLSPASDDEQMRLGMADALISRLGNLRAIVVRPTSATIGFKRESQNALEVGRQLQVDAIVDGTIQRIDDRLRVNVQLVRVSDGMVVWSEKFDEHFTGILALQDSISEKVSEMLVGQLSEDSFRRPNNRFTKNTGAYQEYVRGRYFWNKRDEASLRKAIEYFRRAIDLDPAYALAYAGLADCYMFLAIGQLGDTPPGENFERARASAKKALELDENLSEAHSTLAMISSDYDGKWPEAEKAYLRAIELGPNYATTHHWYALDLLAAGRFDQSVVEVKKAQELDPLSVPINLALGQIYFYLRRYNDAIQQLKRTLELEVDHAPTRIFLGLSYEQKGMLNEALAEFDRVLSRYPNNLAAITARAHTQALMHRQDQAKTVLDELGRRPNLKPLLMCDLAAINTALGNKGEAFSWIEKFSHNPGKNIIIRLKLDPRLDSLRSDPRFQKYI